MSIGDLRFVDPASLPGGTQTRSILSSIGTPESVIDWILGLVRDHREEVRAYEKELKLIHMDMAQ